MKIRFFVLAVILVLVSAASFARDVTWTEADVSLHRSGRATVVYKVRWDYPGDTMGGFDLGGFDRADPYFDYEASCVYDNNNNKRSITIKPAEDNSDCYALDVVGNRLPEHSIWVVKYAADMFKAGYVGYTESEKAGKLVYVDWCPTVFNQPMKHYTVNLIFPLEVSGETFSEEEKARWRQTVLTDKQAMNDRHYLIDYYGQKDPATGKIWLAMRIHKEGPLEAYYEHTLKLYVPADWFELTEYGHANEKPEPVKAKPASKAAGAAAGAAVLAVIMSLIFRKKRIDPHAVQIDNLSSLKWDSASWRSPLIKASTFAVPGKICKDLDAVEICYLLDMPPQNSISSVLEFL
ncbi:MAG: hypothetical protein IJT95_03600, partial [Abditibacteriota bacterium]|nr:hypothetical protein [Abditibacteriota bacterium]